MCVVQLARLPHQVELGRRLVYGGIVNRPPVGFGEAQVSQVDAAKVAQSPVLREEEGSAGCWHLDLGCIFGLKRGGRSVRRPESPSG